MTQKVVWRAGVRCGVLPAACVAPACLLLPQALCPPVRGCAQGNPTCHFTPVYAEMATGTVF